MNAPTPTKIFDRSTLGAQSQTVTVDIERGRIQFFSKVINETNPIHFDLAAAKSAGHTDIIAPVTFPIVITMLANEIIEQQGHQSLFQMIKADYRRLLHGGERYDYHSPIYAGDTVSVTGKVVGFEDKKSGTMEFATLKTTISHADRGDLVTMTSTAIHRLG